MINIITKNINDNNYDNHIYFALNSEDIVEIKKQIQIDHGYLDIILDFNDIYRLQKLIDNVPDGPNKRILINYIYDNYICYKILKETGITYSAIKTTPQGMEEILFSGDFDKFRNMEFVLYMFVEKALIRYREENNKRVRIHLFFDNVKDVLLQQKLNDLIFARQPIVFMGYTTKEKLISYATTNGSFIESPHDYCSYYPEGIIEKMKRKIKE